MTSTSIYQETKHKMRAKKTGVPCPQETKDKISASKTGVPNSKRSAAQNGIPK